MEKNNTYTKKVMQHFFHPKNFGEIKDADGIGEAGNPRCGDVMKVYIKVEKGKIKDIKFQTMGCVAAIAATDVVCELAKGKSLSQAKKISKKDIVKKLDSLPPVKLHCSVLGEKAVKMAVENYEEKEK